MIAPNRKQFSLGSVVTTPGALTLLEECNQSPSSFLQRHATCDWGDVNEEDKRRNDEALNEGGRLLSAYQTAEEQKIWIITEADRSSTCVSLPEEY